MIFRPGKKLNWMRSLLGDETRRKSYELIQKLKLKPLTGALQEKASVKKLTISQKIFRLSVIGLSAAATIALLISLFLLSLKHSGRETPQIVQNIISDTLVIESRQAFTYKQENQY